MKSRPLALTTLALIAASLVGCMGERRTELVRKMERAGAGDVRLASSEAMVQWFHKHSDVNEEIEKACRQMRANAPADWEQTIDGRICAASATARFFNYKPRTPDGATFQAGNKK